MLIVKTRLAVSDIHGIGIFADQDIPRGTTVWMFDEGLDKAYRADELVPRCGPVVEFIDTYTYVSPFSGRVILDGDHARFMNHSEDPNVIEGDVVNGEPSAVAGRDIVAGEELTIDYRATDLDYRTKLD